MQTRRQLLRGAGAAAAGLVVAPRAFAATPGTRLLRGGRFDQGVASGDPTNDAITLWTHIGGVEAPGAVRLEVARDAGFRHVVARRTLRTSSAVGHTIKARLRGLRDGERYHYRFETATAHSPVGRFSTPGLGSREPVRFAFVSCQEFTFGWYNAHALLAREDVDFVLNLGDYIYADVAWPKGLGVRRDPRQVARTLDEYRAKYGLYRSDRDLQAVHARFPMISCWDDHEVQDNYAGRTVDPRRRAAAYRAFFEQMPTMRYGGGDRLYHFQPFGRTLDLFVLDERQYRAAQPCGDKTAATCDEASAPRPFLGADQQSRVRDRVTASPATWKVIANELMIMPRKTAGNEFSDFDAWQGYLQEREHLLEAVRAADDVVFVTGDVHEFIAGDVRDAAGNVVAAEIVGSSITSANDAELAALGGSPETPAQAEARRANSGWTYLDSQHHGYVVCEASRDRFTATMKKVATIKRRSHASAPSTTFTVERGRPGLAT